MAVNRQLNLTYLVRLTVCKVRSVGLCQIVGKVEITTSHYINYIQAAQIEIRLYRIKHASHRKNTAKIPIR